jgi:hypothetical protein
MLDDRKRSDIGAAPAFEYQAATAITGQPPLGESNSSTHSPGIVPPAAGSAVVGANGTLPTTPMFEWQPVANADGYDIVIANAENFSPNVGAYHTGVFNGRHAKHKAPTKHKTKKKHKH